MIIFLAMIVGAIFGVWGVYGWLKVEFESKLDRARTESWRDGWRQAMVLSKEDGWMLNQKTIKAEKKSKRKPKKGVGKIKKQ